METLYESKISVKRWILYDIFGNVGWLLYVVCAGRWFWASRTLPSVLGLLPAALMLVGIVELLSERAEKLDYVLPKRRLYRGFGALTLGGICGTVFAGGMLCRAVETRFLWMLCGGMLCAVFAGLLFREYHPV